MKAYKTTAFGITSIVPANSRGQAKWITYRSALDVGYKVSFGDIRAVRASKHDTWAKTASQQCWEEQYLPNQPLDEDAQNEN